MSLHIRDIARDDLVAIIDLYNEDFNTYNVEFSNGTLSLNGCEIVYTRFILEYWNKLPTEIPIKKEYSIGFKKEITPNTPVALCSEIYSDYLDEYEGTDLDIDDRYMNKVVYHEVINGLYNFCVKHLDPYVQGANSFDLIDLYNHPPIREVNERIRSMKTDPTASDIDLANQEIKKEILENPKLKHNSFVIALRTNSIKMSQMLKMVGSIGYCTDIDSNLFPHPIRSGFYSGLLNLWEFAIESRNASISALYNDLILPISQYSNRRIQLITQSIRWVVRQDCGTNRYKETYISDAKKLKRMKGLWRLGEDSKLVAIKGNEKELVGKVIKHRSIIFCEWSGSRNEVCMTCFGQLYRTAMEFDKDSNANAKGNNLGHISGVTIGEKNSSTVLSRKHDNDNSVASKLSLTLDQQNYFRNSSDGRNLLIHNKSKKLSDIKIVLYKQQVERVHDVIAGVIDTTSPSSTSHIEMVSVIDGSLPDSIPPLPLILGTKQHTGYLSSEALDYIVKYGFEYDEQQNMIVKMNKWDVTQPFITLPQIEFSPPEFIKQLTEFILGPDKQSQKVHSDIVNSKRLSSYAEPAKAVDALYEAVQERLDINYTHLSVIVLAMCAQDPDNNDLRLPFPRHKGVIMSENPLVNGSSFGMSMAYEEQNRILAAPMNYIVHARRSHPLDSLLLSKVHGNIEKVQSPLRSRDERPTGN